MFSIFNPVLKKMDYYEEKLSDHPLSLSDWMCMWSKKRELKKKWSKYWRAVNTLPSYY
jgi:hypothetical protein